VHDFVLSVYAPSPTQTVLSVFLILYWSYRCSFSSGNPWIELHLDLRTWHLQFASIFWIAQNIYDWFCWVLLSYRSCSLWLIQMAGRTTVFWMQSAWLCSIQISSKAWFSWFEHSKQYLLLLKRKHFEQFQLVIY